MMPSVTIIVPVFNVEKYISRCAESLFTQGFEAIEYIFVNDASTDNSFELLKIKANQYPQRKNQIIILQNATNIGVSATRNKGISNAKGDYILMIDADDYIEPDMVEELFNAAVSTNAEMVVSDINIEFESKTVLFQNNISENKVENIKGLLTETTISPSLCSKLIKRSLFSNAECTYNEELIYNEDKYLLLNFLYLTNKITYIQKAFYHYIQYNPVSTTKKITEKHFENILLFWKLTESFLSEKGFLSELSSIVDSAKTKQKAAMLVDTHDVMARRKFAFIYDDIEYKYINKLRFGEKLMLKLLKLKQYKLSQWLHNFILLKNKKAFYLNNKTYYL